MEQKGFYLVSKKSPARLGFEKNEVEKMYVGEYFEHSGCNFEFTIVWENLSGQIVPRMRLYDEAWVIFEKESWKPFLKMMSNLKNKGVSPEELKRKLKEIGFQENLI